MNISYYNEEGKKVEIDDVNYICFLENGKIISIDFNKYSQNIKIESSKVFRIKND